jgi:hypothetical protein
VERESDSVPLSESLICEVVEYDVSSIDMVSLLSSEYTADDDDANLDDDIDYDDMV